MNKTKEITNQIERRGLMLVLSSPSGAGKTSLAKRLLEDDIEITMSVSMTTRTPRPGEINGKDYIFVNKEEFNNAIAKGDLLEWALVFNNNYGTPRKAVDLELKNGRDVLFDIDWQGTQQLGEKVGHDLVRVFILPPDARALEARLNKRGLDTAETVSARMKDAANQISHWAEYDYVIINDNLDQSLAELKFILAAERLHRERRIGLSDFVRGIVSGM